MTKSSWARGCLLVGFVLLAAIAGSDAQAAKAAAKAAKGGSAAGFDGLWSVLIITEQGTCDRGYRYAVRIKNGNVGHADPSNSSFRIGGRVNAGGGIHVSVARGTQTVSVWKDSRTLGKKAAEIAAALAEGTTMDKVEGAVKWSGGAKGVEMNAIFLDPTPITKDNLNLVIDAGHITKAQACEGAMADVAACK